MSDYMVMIRVVVNDPWGDKPYSASDWISGLGWAIKCIGLATFELLSLPHPTTEFISSLAEIKTVPCLSQSRIRDGVLGLISPIDTWQEHGDSKCGFIEDSLLVDS
jgi:hypothetical protein